MAWRCPSFFFHRPGRCGTAGLDEEMIEQWDADLEPHRHAENVRVAEEHVAEIVGKLEGGDRVRGVELRPVFVRVRILARTAVSAPERGEVGHLALGNAGLFVAFGGESVQRAALDGEEQLAAEEIHRLHRRRASEHLGELERAASPTRGAGADGAGGEPPVGDGATAAQPLGPARDHDRARRVAKRSVAAEELVAPNPAERDRQPRAARGAGDEVRVEAVRTVGWSIAAKTSPMSRSISAPVSFTFRCSVPSSRAIRAAPSDSSNFG